MLRRLASITILAAACGTPEMVDQTGREGGGGGGGKADAGDELVLRIDGECASLPSVPFTASEISLDGRELVVPVRYGGGCGEHVFTACWDGSFLESFPVQARVRLVHQSDGDSCEALISRELRVDLARLNAAYRAAYQSTGTIILSVTGAAGSVAFDAVDDRLDAAALEPAFAAAASGANYMSESDYAPVFFTGEPATAAAAFLAAEGSTEPVASSEYHPEEAEGFLVALAEAHADDEPAILESAAAFGRINELFAYNLSDIRVIKFGPATADGSLAEDHGLYAYVVVGTTKDGELVGWFVGSVET